MNFVNYLIFQKLFYSNIYKCFVTAQDHVYHTVKYYWNHLWNIYYEIYERIKKIFNYLMEEEIKEIKKIKNAIIQQETIINTYKNEINNCYDKINNLETKLRQICKHKIKIEYSFNEKYRYCEICGVYL